MTAEQEALLQKARESLRAARLLAANDLIDIAASRAYYTMFYVAQALLLEKALTFSKHSAVIAAFGQHFAKTGLIPAYFHQRLIKSQNKRVIGDYTAKSTLTETDATTMIAQAEEFLALAAQTLGAPPTAPAQATAPETDDRD